MMMIDFSRNM